MAQERAVEKPCLRGSPQIQDLVRYGHTRPTDWTFPRRENAEGKVLHRERRGICSWHERLQELSMYTMDSHAVKDQIRREVAIAVDLHQRALSVCQLISALPSSGRVI